MTARADRFARRERDAALLKKYPKGLTWTGDDGVQFGKIWVDWMHSDWLGSKETFPIFRWSWSYKDGSGGERGASTNYQAARNSLPIKSEFRFKRQKS